MRKTAVVLVCVVALLALAAAAAWAVPPDQGETPAPDLQPIALTWVPSVPYPGQTVTFTITYRNVGTGDLPAGAALTYRILAGERQLAEGQLAAAAALPAGSTATLNGTFYAPEQGDYALKAVLESGDLARDTTVAFKVETALPPGIAQLLAGLGMFAAVMAIMAVGTEVVIDSLKFVVGLKQKITALEALDELKAELPGQLTSLGVDSDTLKKMDRLIGDLQVTLNPVTSGASVADQLKQGHFGAAYAALTKIEELTPDDKQLDGLRQQAIAGVHDGLAALRERLHISPALTQSIEPQLAQLIRDFTPQQGAQLSEQVFAELRQFLSQDPKLTANWLQSQVDALVAQGRAAVDGYLERDVLASLHAVGFDEQVIGAAQRQLKVALDGLQEKASDATNNYTRAVQNLLEAVEHQRNQIQSPLRKIYRRLRASDTLSFGWTVAGALVAVAGVVLACWPGLPVTFWVRLAVAVLGLALGALVGIALSQAYAKRANGTPRLGDGLRSLEHQFNRLLGRTEQLPRYYGQVETEIKWQIQDITPVTLAGVLLQRESKHQDEEASRLRILRVISIFVGGALAYMLEVDALELLSFAVPKIASVNANLHQVWPALPANLTVGIVLTGLAASAGSKFWRDLLGRLQVAREQAETAARLVRQVKGMLPAEEGQRQ
jgi:hypothetical protein